MLKSIVAGMGIFLAGLFGTHQVQPAAPVHTYPPAAHVAIQEAPGTAHPTVPPATTPTPTTIVNQPAIERIIERTMPSASSGITSSELDARLQDLTGKFSTQLGGIAAANAAAPNNFVTVPVFAQAGRIDNLSNVTISNATVHGVSGLKASDIPSLSYLPLSGGIISGDVSFTNATSTNFFATLGHFTTGIIDALTATAATITNLIATTITGTNATFTNATTTNATSTNLYVSGVTTLGSLTGPLQAINGLVSATSTLSLVYGGTGGTNTTTARSNLGLGWAFGTALAARLSAPIATWGDSLTQGTFTNVPYPQQLHTLSGYSIYNGGVGSETSTQIATRMLAATDKYSWPTIIWAGRNDFLVSTATVEVNIASMVAALTSAGNTNYIVLSVLNANNEPSGSANYNTIIQLNGDLASTYGSHYLDIRAYLVSQYDPNQAQDVIDHGNDVPPNSLRYDFLHPNSAGYALVASKIYQNINLLRSTSDTSSVITPEGLRQVLGDFGAGYNINGFRAFYATSTNFLTVAGIGAAHSLRPSGINNSAFGYQALYTATSSSYQTAVGTYALFNDTSGSSNVAVGYAALYNNTTGSSNVAIGAPALNNNTSGANNVSVGLNSLTNSTIGSNNVAVGASALLSNITGSTNVALGANALYQNKSSTSSVAIGYGAAQGAGSSYSNQGGVYVGYLSGFSASTGSHYNTLVGYQSGYGITTGSNNIWIGTATSSTGIANLTTGSQNIIIGNNISVASTTGSGQLNIGNIIFGTGITGTGSTLSTGNVGIGTSSPTTALQVNGVITPSADNTSSLGNATYRWASVFAANGVIQTSDQRLKSSIADLNYGLSDVLKLRPVSFTWTAQPQQGTQLGFIAQEVRPLFPETVNVGDDANHTLGLTYTEFIPVIVKAIQQLAAQVGTKVSTTANAVFDTITARNAELDYVRADNIEVGSPTKPGGITLYDKSGKPGCVTLSDADSGSLTVTKGSCASTNPGSDAASASDGSATPAPDTTPPTITIAGDNPAHINVGDSYADLGASVTDNVDQNLSLKYFLNGALMSNIVVDTSAAATDTIDYVAADNSGNTSTSTRTVIIAPIASLSNSSDATTSAATSTSQ